MNVKRVAIAGEIYSANLGDRAIHGCLCYLVKLLDPSIETISIDISGRASGTCGNTSLDVKQRMALLSAVPGLRLPVTLLKIAHHQIKRLQGQFAAFQKDLETADLLIIGGGQLLMDDALNFPLKLSSLTRQAQSLKLPTHFSACGVGHSWSRWGGVMLRRMLANAQTITLRDLLSQERLSTLAPGIASTVTFDPAIWAASVYPVQAVNRGDCIGLGVLNPREGNLHLDSSTRFSEREWTTLWLDLLGKLALVGPRVELFTTGSPADYAFAVDLLDAARAREFKKLSLAPFPESPETLIRSLCGYSVVAAARLHASILANAYQIPSVGLVWDQKVKAYYAETDQTDVCFNLTNLNPEDVARACAALQGLPFSDTKIEELKVCALESARIALGMG